MLKTKSRKAFTLVEVVCSLAIFFIIILCALSIELVTLKYHKERLDIDNNILAVEAIKNYMIYNMSYEDIKYLKNTNSIYIHKENIDLNKIFECSQNSNNSINSIFTSVKPSDKPYITIRFNEINDVFKISMLLTEYNLNIEKAIEYNFYKGNY